MDAGSAALPLTVLIQMILFSTPSMYANSTRSDTINVEILTCLLQIFDI